MLVIVDISDMLLSGHGVGSLQYWQGGGVSVMVQVSTHGISRLAGISE